MITMREAAAVYTVTVWEWRTMSARSVTETVPICILGAALHAHATIFINCLLPSVRLHFILVPQEICNTTGVVQDVADKIPNAIETEGVEFWQKR
jgi:hypothetical protein